MAIRNIRRDAIDKFKKQQKASEITEDDYKIAEKDIQKLTDDFIKDIDKIAEKKEKELTKIIAETEEALKDAPKGNLRIDNSGNKKHYYLKEKRGDEKKSDDKSVSVDEILKCFKIETNKINSNPLIYEVIK